MIDGKGGKKDTDRTPLSNTGLFDKLPGGLMVVKATDMTVLFTNDLLATWMHGKEMLDPKNILSPMAKLF